MSDDKAQPSAALVERALKEWSTTRSTVLAHPELRRVAGQYSKVIGSPDGQLLMRIVTGLLVIRGSTLTSQAAHDFAIEKVATHFGIPTPDFSHVMTAHLVGVIDDLIEAGFVPTNMNWG